MGVKALMSRLITVTSMHGAVIIIIIITITIMDITIMDIITMDIIITVTIITVMNWKKPRKIIRIITTTHHVHIITKPESIVFTSLSCNKIHYIFFLFLI